MENIVHLPVLIFSFTVAAIRDRFSRSQFWPSVHLGSRRRSGRDPDPDPLRSRLFKKGSSFGKSNLPPVLLHVTTCLPRRCFATCAMFQIMTSEALPMSPRSWAASRLAPGALHRNGTGQAATASTSKEARMAYFNGLGGAPQRPKMGTQIIGQFQFGGAETALLHVERYPLMDLRGGERHVRIGDAGFGERPFVQISPISGEAPIVAAPDSLHRLQTFLSLQ